MNSDFGEDGGKAFSLFLLSRLEPPECCPKEGYRDIRRTAVSTISIRESGINNRIQIRIQNEGKSITEKSGIQA